MDLSKLPPRPNAQTTPPPAAPVPVASSLSPDLAAPAGICPTCAFALRAGAKFCDHCGAPAGANAIVRGGGSAAGASTAGYEAWFSIGIGVLLLFFAPTLLLFVSSKLLHTRFTPFADANQNPSASVTMFDADGSTRVIPYLKTTAESSPNFQSDLAVTLFALAMIVEGIALFISQRRMVMLFALGLTIAATIANALYLIISFGHGLAILPAIAVIFGGSMAFYQFGLFQQANLISAKTK